MIRAIVLLGVCFYASGCHREDTVKLFPGTYLSQTPRGYDIIDDRLRVGGIGETPPGGTVIVANVKALVLLDRNHIGVEQMDGSYSIVAAIDPGADEVTRFASKQEFDAACRANGWAAVQLQFANEFRGANLRAHFRTMHGTP